MIPQGVRRSHVDRTVDGIYVGAHERTGTSILLLWPEWYKGDVLSNCRLIVGFLLICFLVSEACPGSSSPELKPVPEYRTSHPMRLRQSWWQPPKDRQCDNLP